MTPEEKSRQRIDAMLIASGWLVQTKDRINLSAACGVAIGEHSFATGEPDYVLFVEGKAIGTIEAKPKGETLTGVEEQSTKFVSGVPLGLPAWKSPLPFCYERARVETSCPKYYSRIGSKVKISHEATKARRNIFDLVFKYMSTAPVTQSIHSFWERGIIDQTSLLRQVCKMM